jgi:predicted DNA repair protein MutK
MRGLSGSGSLAMFMIGGGIISHNVAFFIMSVKPLWLS